MTRSDRWIGSLFFLFGLFVVWQASKLEFASSYGAGSGFFPFWLGVVTVILGAIVTLTAWRNPSGADTTTAPRFSKQKIAAFLALLAFVSTVGTVGFIIAFSCLSAFLLKLEGESWLSALSVSSASGIAFYLFFVRLLAVTLPVGPLGF
ncbi:MAG: tripartite tricarboxylate transporter TctB family protein [Candidatus Binatia bacterium]